MKFTDTQLYNRTIYRWAHDCELRWIERVVIWLVRRGWVR